MNTITTTNFNFPNQKSVYRGKVREVYNINDELLVMVATDRLSAFDVVLPEGIPYKGQILNQIATKFMELTQDIVPNWLIATPDPNVAVGHLCEPFKVEMVIRGYLSGHAAREYALGKRTICGVTMPEGLKENDQFPTPIITPTTKADNGSHDEDISRSAILAKNIVSEQDYLVLEKYTRDLYQRGTEIAASRGLILVDTKYEFGKTKEGKIVLIDEIHTPDSSRYFYAEGYQDRQNNEEEQKQLSKEFVRRWLIENGFQGQDGQEIPEMNQEYITSVSERYIELYENILGEKFVKADISSINDRIEKNVLEYLQNK
ncbi:phosphoribosylaminoimidazolesuccinocarboxamide synthase [Flavobacterium psychrophilum]|uniref:phosphoribosylaminoimidazolesuccinocarboxamide synthase n=1 Tax=Flavobacterium psychrophilum TaxID=96345 RepID=UPI0007C5A8C2|nr:phosphoribosylaminoimidazolesuccinocarboxamide synthase [Flavobacterium psychrophilum]EKT3964624.1 phosphoribosylaminoimidazolesuccinocarboxamide synthase [Flavobacterium psychrophilum]EKT3965830.1 phosphoribosylaminoimidazolesuccinocarboxamide synthase [Flavobacterium psychrophilum]EKT4518128.1 phosphoribosylaminoimidazolesuccinocarboxamide synthase [Flavobacterium psychrophilum]EKT4549906.1 phosphoribosylaminoimidazolesuccinocarboxamide synthase [Flavobacterium psychrophilum]EKT4551551.1 